MRQSAEVDCYADDATLGILWRRIVSLLFSSSFPAAGRLEEASA